MTSSLKTMHAFDHFYPVRLLSPLVLFRRLGRICAVTASLAASRGGSSFKGPNVPRLSRLYDAEPESWPESEFSCDSEQGCLHRGPTEELSCLDCSDVALGTCTEVLRRLLIFLFLLENLNILLWVFILLPHTANAGPSSAAE